MVSLILGSLTLNLALKVMNRSRGTKGVGVEPRSTVHSIDPAIYMMI